MQRFYLLLGLAAFLTHPLNSPAQIQKAPLTLPQAIQKAIEFNPSLVASGRDIDIADAGLVQAKAWPNPELEVLSEGVNEKYQTTTAQINHVIELGGKRSSRISVAERDWEAALADLASQRTALRADVAAAFFDVLAAQERIQLAETSYQLGMQVNSVVKRRVAAGRVSPIEATRTSVAELTIRSELNQARVDFELAKIRLAALWGETAPKFNEVDQPAAGNNFYSDEFYNNLPTLQSQLKNSPQLIRAQLEIERQQAQEDVERSQQIGDVTVSIGNKRETEFGRNQTIVGITVPLPLFDRNQGNVLGALRKTDKARDELHAITQRLSSELAQTYQRYAFSKADLQLLRTEILPQAESVIAATIKGFEFGKFNLLDVLEAQRTLFQTKSQYLKTQADLYRSVADIERIVGSDQLTRVINEK